VPWNGYCTVVLVCSSGAARSIDQAMFTHTHSGTKMGPSLGPSRDYCSHATRSPMALPRADPTHTGTKGARSSGRAACLTPRLPWRRRGCGSTAPARPLPPAPARPGPRAARGRLRDAARVRRVRRCRRAGDGVAGARTLAIKGDRPGCEVNCCLGRRAQRERVLHKFRAKCAFAAHAERRADRSALRTGGRGRCAANSPLLPEVVDEGWAVKSQEAVVERVALVGLAVRAGDDAGEACGTP
jgi:hypothetical protein